MSYVRGLQTVTPTVSHEADLVANTQGLHIITVTLDTTVRDVKSGDTRPVISASTWIRCGFLCVVLPNGKCVAFNSTDSAGAEDSSQVVVLYETVDLAPHIAAGDAVVPARAIYAGKLWKDRIYGDLAGFDNEKAQRIILSSIRPS